MSAIQQVAVTQITTPGNSNYDPYYSNVSLLLSMNGSNGSTSFVDASPNQKTLAVFGNTQISTAQSKFGGSSASFDGNGDYLTIPSSTDLDISTGDFTIEAWVRLNAMPTTDTLSVWQNWMIIYERGSASASDGWQFQIGQTLLMFSDSYGTAVCSGTHGMVINTWYHLSVTRSGTTFRVFVNGVQVGTSTSSITLNSGPTYWIGTETGEGAYLNGYIDDLRVTKGIARYTSNFTVPAYANPLTGPQYDPFYNNVSLLLHCNGRNASTNFIDNSGSPKTVTVNGNAQMSTAQWKFNGSSAYFDGTTAYLTAAATTDLTMGTGDFTYECFVYPTGVPQFAGIFGNGNGSNPNPYLYLSNLTPVLFFNGVNVVTGPILTINTWSHIAVVRTSGSLRIYSNGVMGTPVANSTNLTCEGIYIGGASNGTQIFLGYIAELRITKGVARYTSNFTPPRVPYADSGINIDNYYDQTVLLLPMNGANASTSFIDSSKTANIISVTGNTQISTTQSKFGGSSVYFDGNIDWLSLPSTNINFQSSDFTIEFWIYRTASTLGTAFSMARDQSGTGYGPVRIDFTTSLTVRPLIANSSNTGWASTATGTATIPLNTWGHYALVKSGTTITQYINGVLDLTLTSMPATFSDVSRDVTIGYNNSTDGQYLTGYLDDFRITKGIARYTSTFTPPVRPNPTTGVQYDNYYDNVSLLLHMNGPNNGTSFVDNSLRAKTITAYVNAVTSTTQYKYGVSSLYLDNSGTRRGLEVLNISGTGTEDFTYEAWVYPISLTGTVGLNILFDHRIGTGHTNGMFMYISSSGNIAIYNITASSNTVTLNQWNHVAYVRASGILTYYINGISGGSQAFTRNNIDTSLYIGTPNDTTQYQWVGYLDDVRITNGIARYGTNGDPFYSNVSLLLHMDGSNGSTTFIDNSIVPKTVTVGGNTQISTAQSVFGGSSALFDGTGDYLQLSSSSSLIMGTGDLTIEAWIYLNSVSTWASVTGTLSFDAGASFRITTTAMILDSSGINSVSRSATINLNTWYHVAVTRASGTVRFFLNGIQQGADQTYTQNFSGETRVIGGSVPDNAGWVNGYMDDVRITKGIARYTANFTPPTQPFLDNGVNFTPPTQAFPDQGPQTDPFYYNTSLLLHFDGTNASTNFVDNSPVIKSITPSGNAQISTAQSKFGGSSAYFDGTGDLLFVPASNDFNFGTNPWTIECWVRIVADAGGVIDVIIGNRASNFLSGQWYLFYVSSNIVFDFRVGGSDNNTVGATGISLNTWYHIAVVRNGTNFAMYKDGVLAQASTIDISNSIGSTLYNISIGNSTDSSFPLNGYIDDLRITKGVARYVNNFTPPQRPFPDQ